MRFRQIDEAFDWVLKGQDKKERTQRLMDAARSNQVLVPIVKLGVGADTAEWNLPEGRPEKAKIQDDIPEGMGETTLTLEWRRVKGFIEEGSNMNKLPTWKREAVWLQILEGVHHKEADILTAVKDGTLLSLYPQLEELLEGIGITEYTKPKKKRAPRKKAAA